MKLFLKRFSATISFREKIKFFKSFSMRSVQIENFYVCLVMLTVLCEGIAVPLCEAENAETPVKEHFQTVSKL